MSRWKALIGLVLGTILLASLGYVFATGYVSWRLFGQSSLAQPDFTLILRHWPDLRQQRPADAQIVQLIIGGSVLGGLLVGALLASEALTRFGQTRWQTLADLKTNGFFSPAGRSFVLAKTPGWRARGRLLSSGAFPHCLVVAPTGRGKGVGFVIPNLLRFQGSAVVLDVKGENFLATSRHRQAQGDRVFRFAPTDWERPTHRYNPLERIAAIDNPDRQLMELQLTASLFLQADNDRVAGLLDGGIDLFTAAGMLAFERGIPTLGEIYRITAAGGDKRVEYLKRGVEVKNPAAKLIFERMASTNNDTLTSYLSLLMTSGLKTWANPAIDRATSVSDISFRDIRRWPQSIYLVVAPEMLRPLAPLIRLFFSDLIASLQAAEPGDDEPWPVMILLDEFDRLGKLPTVAESIKTLRSYGGHLALVTQTIPALDEIYGENTRMSLQGGAGLKLYLTPSEEKTVEELSRAVGKTTKRVVTRSRAVSANPFRGRSVSERSEEVSLLPEDEARRLDLDEVILVVDAQHPIRARRIKYFEDAPFKALFEAQKGPHPYPGDLQDKLDALSRSDERRDAEARQSRAELAEVLQVKQELEQALAKAMAAIPPSSASVAPPAPAPTPAADLVAKTPASVAAPELVASARRTTRRAAPVSEARLDKSVLAETPEVMAVIEAARVDLDQLLPAEARETEDANAG